MFGCFISSFLFVENSVILHLIHILFTHINYTNDYQDPNSIKINVILTELVS